MKIKGFVIVLLLLCLMAFPASAEEWTMELVPGETSVEFTEFSRRIVFTFTPEESGVYSFRSRGEVDTFCNLSHEEGYQLLWDEDSGAGDNFAMVEALEAGVTYQFLVRSFTNYGPFQVVLKQESASTEGMYGTCGEELVWVMDEAGHLTISGTGPMKEYWESTVPWKQVTSVTIGEDVTSIGEYAFYGCSALKEVTIPDTVTEIGTVAFGSCTGLEKIELPEGLTTVQDSTFDNCTALKEIVLPDSVTEIRTGAFSECTSLEKVTMGGGVTEIYSLAFYKCDSLVEVLFGGSEEQWQAIEFHGNDGLENARVHFGGGSVEHGYTSEIIPPTCYEQGYTLHTCPCGTSYTDSIVSVSWHDYKETSEADGCAAYTCTVCGAEFTESSPYYAAFTESWNNGENDYPYFASDVMESNLICNADGTYTRVECEYGPVMVELYDADLNFMSHKELQRELPLFGGYYTNGTYHFLVFGQTNHEENDETEIMRVVKYDLDWNRLGSASLYGCNTTIPFDAGSLRMAACGDVLYVRTCHKMYTSSDGLNHQASFLANFRIPDMAVMNVLCKVGGAGYCSHSFNQFVLVDGDDLLSLDHGDAYPRAAVLVKYDTPAGEGDLTDGDSEVKVMEFIGRTGLNGTGAKIGGFEASGSAYLVAGASILHDGSVELSGPQNIFVTVTDKENFSEEGTRVLWLTNYGEADRMEVSAPQLVKLSGDKFCILWTQFQWGEDGWALEEELCYTFLNGSGQQISEIYKTADGALSDCKPIVTEDAILWYVTDGEQLKFYSIDPDTHALSCEATYGAEKGPKVTASNEEDTGKIKLTWKKLSGTGEYRVFRSESEKGPYQLVKTTTSRSFIDDGAVTGQRYYYYVVAVDGDGVVSRPANVVSRTSKYTEPEVLLGDVDGNGVVDFFDGMLVLQYYAGLIGDRELNVSAADVDGSGEVDFFDGMYILQFYAGLIDTLGG